MIHLHPLMKFYTLLYQYNTLVTAQILDFRSINHLTYQWWYLPYYIEWVDVKNLFIEIQRPVVTGTCFIILFISLNTCNNFILLVVWFFLWNKSLWLHVSYRSIPMYTYRIKLEAPKFPICIDGLRGLFDDISLGL